MISSPRRPLSAADVSGASTPARGIGKRWVGATLGASGEASIGWGLCAISNPELPQTEAELAQFYQDRIMEAQQKHLEPLREDLADWLNRILGLEHLSSDSFLEALEDGILICQLARLVQDKAKEVLASLDQSRDPSLLPDVAKSRRMSSEESKLIAAKQVPMKKIKCWERAPRRSFFSRENACNFLEFCRNLGIHESVLFESEGLVLHTQPRNVILCLLDVGRKAARLGMDAPALVQLERDIDRQLYERGEDEALLGGALHLRNHINAEGPTSPVLLHDGELTELDKKVEELAIASQSECRCVAEHCARLQIRKISEGLYFVAGRNVFIRLLKDRHVMVRVGGGWDTLEHFLIRHDPCRGGSSLRSRSPTPDTTRTTPKTSTSSQPEGVRTKTSYARSPSAPTKMGSTPCLIDLDHLSPAVTPRRVMPVRRAQTARLPDKTDRSDTKRSLGDLTETRKFTDGRGSRIRERPTSLLDVSRRGNSIPNTPVGGPLPPKPVNSQGKFSVGRTASFHFGTNRQALSKPLVNGFNLDSLVIKHSKKTLSNNSINELDERPRWK